MLLYNREIGGRKIIRRFQFFLTSLCIHLAALAIFSFIVLENASKVQESVAVQMLKAPKETRKTRHIMVKARDTAILDHQLPEMIQHTPQTLISPENTNTQNSTDIIPIYQYESLDAKPAKIQPKLSPVKHAIPPPRIVVSRPGIYQSQESIFDLRQPFETVIQKPSFSFHKSDDTESKAILRSFLDLVSQRIEKAKRYPAWALDAGIQGRVVIRFTILQDGTLEQDLKMVESSGTEILDNAAMAAIRAAAPFPAIPSALKREKLRIELPMDFSLTES